MHFSEIETKIFQKNASVLIKVTDLDTIAQGHLSAGVSELFKPRAKK